jgi:PHD/YefM family antitoxin component YafN of YafNO toxin-antitoxin module
MTQSAHEPLVVTSTEFQRAIGELFTRIRIDQRLVIVTMHDRPALVMMPHADYALLRRRRQDDDAAARLWAVTL